MKAYITLILLVCSVSITAQKPLDTIYVNDKKNVALFFPNPIRQGIVGASHFVFTYNREKAQYFGLLQGGPGVESNLLTLTNDGYVYSYILKYKEKLSKLNYFITESESIGNEKPKIEAPEVKKDNLDINTDSKTIYSKRFSEYLLRSKHEYAVRVKRKKGMVLKLLNIRYHKDKVYLVLEIKNRSGIDFEIDFLNVYRANGNKKRKASFQRLPLDVIYKHKSPRMVGNSDIKRFVYVLPKFVLGDNEKLEIELQELKGSRALKLKN